MAGLSTQLNRLSVLPDQRLLKICLPGSFIESAMSEEAFRGSLATVFVVGIVFSLLRYNLGKM